MGIYPFNDLGEFERFRSLAMQDTAAAAQRAQLRSGAVVNSIARVYYGPPGTGKTLAAVRQAVELADPGFTDREDFTKCFMRFNELTEQVIFLTFHQSLQYEDVVESIRPILITDGAAGEAAGIGDVQYMLHTGPIMRLIDAAAKRPDREHIIVIDEINRGDISRILGPLISAIEPDKRAGSEFPIGFETQYPRGFEERTRIYLPPNLHILGTMNSADRNIALVDYALRRRFEFVECPPLPSLLSATSDSDSIDLRALLTTLNRRVNYLLDQDHRIGHGYFMGCRTNADAVDRFARRVLPLLAEYFYGNAANLLLVLGDKPAAPFNVHSIETADNVFDTVFGVPLEDAVKIGYRAQRERISVSIDPRFWDPDRPIAGPRDTAYAVKALQKIYGGEQPSAGNSHETADIHAMPGEATAN